MNNTPKRLESLDALRGFDLFLLVGLEAVMHALDGAIDAPWFDRLMWCFTHVDWEGFSSWDLVMPLFMFMSDITIPFALARYKREGSWLIDYKGRNKHVGWIKVYGMNSIVAYMLATCVNFSSVSRSLFYGLQQYVGDFYPALIAISNAIIIYLIL